MFTFFSCIICNYYSCIYLTKQIAHQRKWNSFTRAQEKLHLTENWWWSIAGVSDYKNLSSKLTFCSVFFRWTSSVVASNTICFPGSVWPQDQYLFHKIFNFLNKQLMYIFDDYILLNTPVCHFLYFLRSSFHFFLLYLHNVLCIFICWYPECKKSFLCVVLVILSHHLQISSHDYCFWGNCRVWSGRRQSD